MRGIRAGRLKDALDIQRNTLTVGEIGGQVDSWATVDTDVPCDISPKSESEFYKGSGENVIGVYEIRFRFEDGLVEENDRFVDTTVSPNKILDIASIIDPGNWETQIVVMALHRKWPLRD